MGIQTAVEFLQKKGFADVEPNSNTKITDEQYQMLVAEFKKDKGLRDDAAAVSRKRQHKEKKASISLPEEKPAPQPESTVRKGPKIVGHIDLDSLNGRRPAAPAAQQPAPAPAPRWKAPRHLRRKAWRTKRRLPSVRKRMACSV